MRTKRVPTCHPEEPHKGRGLCRRCYRQLPHINAAIRRASKKRYNKQSKDPAYINKRRKYANALYHSKKHVWRDSRKNSKLKAEFGITYSTFQSMFQEQQGLCRICRKPETSAHASGAIKSLAVDHCHKTGRVRGLLCVACNTGLGRFEDDISLLESALAYLKIT